MFDNGLLKHYKSGLSKGGYLNADELGINKRVIPFSVDSALINGEKYFLKSTGKAPKPRSVAKCRQDAEILLGQIYSKLGIPSAIYLPAQNSHGKFIITKSVASPQTEMAGSHIFPFIYGTRLESLPFFYKEETTHLQALKDELVSKLYTPQAMREQSIMRVLDVACFNEDRHNDNFFYSLKYPTVDGILDDELLATQTLQYYKDLPINPITGVVAIDYEYAGKTLHEFASGNRYAGFFNLYETDFDHAGMLRETAMEQFKTNEEFNSVVNMAELAENIGSLNVEAVAQDIKETTDYEVSPKVVSALSQSFENMAEELSQ